MRGTEVAELFHPAPSAASIDRGTTMYEDLSRSLVDQRTDRLLDEACRDRLLHLDAESDEPRRGAPVRVRLGHALIGLGGHIAGGRPETAGRRGARPAA